MLDTFFAEQEFSGHQSQQFKLYDVKIRLVTCYCNTFLCLAGDMIDVLTYALIMAGPNNIMMLLNRKILLSWVGNRLQKYNLYGTLADYKFLLSQICLCMLGGQFFILTCTGLISSFHSRFKFSFMKIRISDFPPVFQEGLSILTRITQQAKHRRKHRTP